VSGGADIAHTISSQDKGVLIQFLSPIKVTSTKPLLVQADLP
jgi:hypothetical protein